MLLSIRSVVLFCLCAHVSTALYVAKGTPCSSKCNSTGGTWWPDLVCSTNDFADTSKGQTLQACLSCTIDSLYINTSYTDGNSDQFWSLFHMKYVQEYCLIDTTTPHIAAVNACTSACSPLSTVLDTLWINKHPFVGQYDYCTEDSSAYPNFAGDCAKCLQSQDDSVILGNFVDAMSKACSSRPLAASGDLIVLNRDLFDTSIKPSIAITMSSTSITTMTTTDSSSTKASSSSTSASNSISSTTVSGNRTSMTTSTSTTGTVQNGTSETNPAAGNNESNNQTDHTNTGRLSTGAAAGIGAAIAIAVIAILAGLGFWFFRQRQHNSRESLPQSPAVELMSHPYSFNPWNVKPGMEVYEKGAGGFDGQLHEAPNASQRNLIELSAFTKK